jgi:hypothetical protein
LEPDAGTLSVIRLKRFATAGALALAILTSACGTQSSALYRWGDYEGVLYDLYIRPGKADPMAQISRLTEDVTRTQAAGQRVPPGVHAHLGYLHYSQGQLDAAYEQFATEKALFPESGHFVDGILVRMTKQQQRKQEPEKE